MARSKSLMQKILRDPMRKKRWRRALIVFLGTGLSTAGSMAVVGAPWYAILMSAIGAGITAAGAAINLGEMNPTTPSSAEPPSQTPPAAGFARVVLLVVLAVVAVLVVLLIWQIDARREAEQRLDLVHAQALAAEERGKLARLGIATQAATTRKGLEDQLAAAVAAEAAATGKASRLEALVKKLQAASPGAQVVELETGDTGAIPTNVGPEGRVCWFWAGDQGRIRTGRARADTQAGNRAVVATADAWNESTGLHLFGQELHLQSDFIPPPPPPGPLRYGLGLRGQCVSGGCAAGIAGTWQPWRHLELSADMAFYGASAARGAGAAVLFRW